MKRMQLIQPQLTKLRDQHKKNPEKLHKEMMELYKKHKVNPFGGCLPMLLQTPVFIALYVSLSKTAELMNSRFLWIHDLSSPDKVRLPFALPLLGFEIHVLPLIVAALMAVQQKFTMVKMEGQDPAMEAQQRMMAVIMPIMFGFFLYGLPSGLCLYWLTHTLLTTLYQLRIKNLKLA
jgi:YidC/Oxa1 family membrane protein insertase